MEQSPDDRRAAVAAAAAVHAGFGEFHREFVARSRLARARFEARQWHALHADSVHRLELYAEVVGAVGERLRRDLGARAADSTLWPSVKREFAALVAGQDNAELARTFYSSVTRRLFSTVGVRPEIEFLADEGLPEPPPGEAIVRRHAGGPPVELVEAVLAGCGLDVPFEDRARDAARVAAEIERYLVPLLGPRPIDAIDVLRPLFFRHTAAFVVGRIHSGRVVVPFVLPLLHEPRGVRVDAVLTSQDDVSILFSFARSHFQVEAACPAAVIAFLQTILPRKPVAELYVSLGFHKHGKSRLYADLQRHLRAGRDRFRVAEGDRGMVMLVFALGQFDVVFKVIRDRFDFPKRTTRAEVMKRYGLVFKHDRVGRLVDAQEFQQLTFDRALFAPQLLDELLTEAAGSVSVRGDEVVISHLYTERKVVPLNLYLRQADQESAWRAVIDYGNTIKELAAANIFPGDFLTKNFGVTRHGRVVFYDYDELCLLDECTFRSVPPPRSPDEELDAEPWFRVGENDVFPEEFDRFLGLPDDLRDVFEHHHRDLFRADFWRAQQARIRRGEVLDFFPYPPARRLARETP